MSMTPELGAVYTPLFYVGKSPGATDVGRSSGVPRDTDGRPVTTRPDAQVVERGPARPSKAADLAERWLREKRVAGGSIHSDRARRSDLESLARYIEAGPRAPEAGESGRGAPALADRALTRLTTQDLTTGALNRGLAAYGEYHALASVHRVASTWRGFCGWLHRQNLLPPDVTPTVDRPAPAQQAPKVLSLEELGHLVRAASSRDAQARCPWPERDIALLSSFVSTGMRPGEAIALVVGDLRLGRDGGRLVVGDRALRERELALPDVVTTSLLHYLEDRAAKLGRAGPASALFVRPSGDPLTTVGLNYVVGRWFRRAGVPEPHGSLVYVLRHTYATLLSESGVEIGELQHLLGHRRLSTTGRYVRKPTADPRRHIHANPAIRLLAATPLPG